MNHTFRLLWCVLVFSLFFIAAPERLWALASNNIPLDSPVYSYLEKLAGFGLLSSDIKALKPYSKAEAARLLFEAERNLDRTSSPPFARDLIKRLRELLPREADLRNNPEKAPLVDYHPAIWMRLRYVYLDGIPRSYTRDAYDPANQSAFGFIGGNLRPQPPSIVHKYGTEGTPLVENNEGAIYHRGHSGELQWGMEGYISNIISLLVEPSLSTTPDDNDGGRVWRASLQKAYVKLGSGGLELEVGRDANWFGPGYRGSLTLSSNARNFDLVKLSSPEPLDVGWVKSWFGDLKYAVLFSRFDNTGSGSNERQPWFIGTKLSLKPKPWLEIGGNFVRQEGGPGFAGSTNFLDLLFGGGYTNKSNSIAGVDIRFRLPWLRNTEVYAEYVGEDSALFWPFVESYVAGFYIPCLTPSGKDDLRFEYFWGHQILYSDVKFPHGYTYKLMSPGHSQGGGAEEFFLRYSHWFSVRNNLALEYFHTERGNVGRVPVNSSGKYDPDGVSQAVERKNTVRLIWSLPIHGNFDIRLMYGWERIHNFDLVGGANRSNQVAMFDLTYNY